MALVSLQQAKMHLRIDDEDTDHNAEVSAKLSQAEQIVLDRVNTTTYWRTVSAAWTDANVPGAVQAAILVTLAHLYEHRGEDTEKDDTFWAALDRVLALHKDPVIA